MLIAADRLHQLVVDTFAAAGATRQNAELVANHLVLADRSGVRTHGIIHLPLYLEQIEAGDLVPTARPRIQRSHPGREVVDGQLGFGHVAAEFAIGRAIELATSAGVGLVGLVHVNHIGRLGHYVELACQAGALAMVWGGGYGAVTPRAVPYGGRDPVLDTNPIAIGVPVRDRPPVVVDFATTALSGVKVSNVIKRGESLPPRSIVDAQGTPTTDPNEFTNDGAYLPFGGEHGAHKGFGLMLAAELLGRAFSGADSFAEEGRGPALMRHQGVSFWVARIDALGSADAFYRDAGAIVERVIGSRHSHGHDQVAYPGLPEARARERADRDGVEIEERVWDEISAAARKVGVDWES